MAQKSELTNMFYHYLFFCFGLLMFFSYAAHASIFKRDEKVIISSLHQIDEDIYVFCENFVVDGEIDGDLAAFSEKILINGDITGSAILSSNKLTVNGHIERSLRVFANSILINGRVDRAFLVFGNDIDINEGATIGQDVTAFGNTIHVSGVVQGNKSSIRGAVVTIAGTFTGDVHIQGEKIRIEPTAVILGDLTYTSNREESITIAPGATIEGATTWLPQAPDKTEETSTTTVLVVTLSKLLAAFLFGIILLSLLRKYGEEAFYQIRNRFATSLAVGILALLIFLFAILVLIVTIILFIVGLALSSGDSAAIGAMALIFSILSLPICSFATITGAVIFYSGKIVVGFLLGYAVVRLFVPSPAVLGKLQLFTGLLVLTLLFIIPYVGFLIYLFVSIVGAGAIILGIQHCRKVPEPSQLK